MYKHFLLCISLLPFFIQAQSGFGEAQLIDDLGFQVSIVFSSDIDGDGDMDVLVSGQNANTIAWYENLDGQGTFGPIQYVDQNLNFTQSLRTADFNGDGDMDILATSANDNTVVWYENLDGQGDFSTANIIAAYAPNAKQAIPADINEDNKMDVVAVLKDAGKVVWYENLNGQGDFSNENIVSNNIIFLSKIDVADLDGDGFLDVLSNSSSIGYPSWFKNINGQGTFGTENIIDLINTNRIKTADLDGDGDQDIIKTEYAENVHSVRWLENTDGLGTFMQKQLITDLFQIREVYPSDLDNDGDIDLLAVYVGDGKIAWFENLDGLGTFGERIIIDDVASITIVAADIDGDGYKDVVTKMNQSQVAWYKNLTYLTTADHTLQNISLVPNPTKGIVTIKKSTMPIQSISIYTVLGNLLFTQKNTSQHIDISLLPAGLYFFKIQTAAGVLVKKVIKE